MLRLAVLIVVIDDYNSFIESKFYRFSSGHKTDCNQIYISESDLGEIRLEWNNY